VLREHYAQRFHHILVDEFQDTNRLQYRWLKLFNSKQNAYFCVGDDDQSIYTFRARTSATWPTSSAEFKVAKVIRLEQNYRSHGHILDAANALIANNKNRLGKNLWTAAGAGEPLPRIRRRVRRRRGALDRRGSEVPAARGHAARAHGGCIARTRSRASSSTRCSRRGRLPRYRRPALLRARRGEARARLPAADRLAGDDNAFLRVVNFPRAGSAPGPSSNSGCGKGKRVSLLRPSKEKP